MANMSPQGDANAQVKGSLPLGLAIGFFTGCIGAIIVQFVAKGSDTKKGAWIGFVVGIFVWGGLNFVLRR